MLRDQMKSVPVDPNNPEKPIKLIIQATQYLVDEFGRLQALAADGSECKTAFAAGVLLDALRARIETYQQRGLQAIVHIVNELVREYDKPAVQTPTSPEGSHEQTSTPAA